MVCLEACVGASSFSVLSFIATLLDLSGFLTAAPACQAHREAPHDAETKVHENAINL